MNIDWWFFFMPHPDLEEDIPLIMLYRRVLLNHVLCAILFVCTKDYCDCKNVMQRVSLTSIYWKDTFLSQERWGISNKSWSSFSCSISNKLTPAGLRSVRMGLSLNDPRYTLHTCRQQKSFTWTIKEMRKYVLHSSQGIYARPSNFCLKKLFSNVDSILGQISLPVSSGRVLRLT